MIIPEHPYTERERTACRILAEIPSARSMLNIGMRNPTDPRNQWWLRICRANGIEPHVLEVFEPNARELRDNGIPNVNTGDVHDISRIFTNRFDVILWWHGPEHLEKAEALRVIGELKGMTEKALIIGCPHGHEPQDVCYGNVHEQHLSGWEPDEFQAADFETTVVNDGPTYGHITAWRLKITENQTVDSNGVIAKPAVSATRAIAR